MIEETELRSDHVKDRDNGKACRPWLTRSWIYGRWTCRSIASSKDVRTNDEELVRVESAAWANEALPPAFRLIQLSRSSVRRGRQAGMEEDHVVLGW